MRETTALAAGLVILMKESIFPGSLSSLSQAKVLRLQVKSFLNLEPFLFALEEGQSDCDHVWLAGGRGSGAESVKSSNHWIIVPDRASFVFLSYLTFP